MEIPWTNDYHPSPTWSCSYLYRMDIRNGKNRVLGGTYVCCSLQVLKKKLLFQVTQYACTRTFTCAFLYIIYRWIYVYLCISWLISVCKNIYAEFVDKYFIWRSLDLDLKEYYHFNRKTVGSKIQRSLGALSQALPPQSCMAPFCRKLGYGNCSKEALYRQIGGSKNWCHAGVVQCANIHNYKWLFLYIYTLYYMNTFHSKKHV